MSFKRSCHFQDPSFSFLLLCFLSQLPLYHGECNSSLNGPKSLMVLFLEFRLYSSALIGSGDKGLLSVIKHSFPLPKYSKQTSPPPICLLLRALNSFIFLPILFFLFFSALSTPSLCTNDNIYNVTIHKCQQYQRTYSTEA